MVIAALSGGVLNFNLSGGGEGEGFSDFFKEPSLEKIPQETSHVLGVYTDSLLEVFRNISPGVWLILAISIFLAILAAITISIFIRNWAKGSLIASIHRIEDKKTTTLRSGSLWGLSVVKRFIYLNVIPWLILGIILLVLIILPIVALSLTQSETTSAPILALILLLSIGIGIVAGVILTLIIILAEQLVIRENLSAKQALNKGLRLTKKYFGAMFVMGAINLGIGCAFGCATFIVIMLLIVIVILAFAISKEAGFIVAVFAGIPVLAFILLSILIRGIYRVFNTSTWTLLAREIESKEKEGETHE